uniref:Glycosyltransferase RgtA/B/C/D-like domain-containing protein n=1 Tax=Eiseniibacteriota bacterium TaxID=2212470 RepID=A0A832MK63_UNCEI
MRPAPSPRAATCALVLAALAAWVALSPPGANDLVGGDEGYYGTMARNVLAGPRWLASPSLWPLGPPGDKPPLYPALLAGSVALLGPTEAAVRWPSLAFAALTALATAAFAAAAARQALGAATAAAGWAGFAAAAFLLSAPWFADASRIATAEHPLTALGAGALALLARPVAPAAAGRPERPAPPVGTAFAAGALLGLAFLCKLWLVALLALPAAALLAPARAGLTAGASARALLALGAGFLATGSLQIAAVAAFRPAELPHWRDVYLGFSLAGRMGGEGFDASWIKPPHYYAATLGRALAPALPFALAGAWAMAGRAGRPAARALLAWAAGVLVLSAFRVKSGVYLYPVVPAWAALAGIGAAALAGAGAAPGAARAPWRRAAAAAAALAVLAGFAWQARKLPPRHHDPGYRDVAAALAPRLASADPAAPSYVAPEAPAFGFYLARAGRYWGSPYRPWRAAQRESVAADRALRAFVVDPSRRLYGGWPDSATLAWLEAHTRELTDSIAAARGRPLGVRVFVR